MSRQERMKGSIAWMARNPVAANLLMIGLIACGLAMALFQLRKEVWPVEEPDAVRITMTYPGASPAEVEQGVILPIEDAVRSLDGVKEMYSTAEEGHGRVWIELEAGTDRNKALADVKNAVDRIVSFPQNAERPVVLLPKYRAQAIWLVFYGDQDSMVLRTLAERARDQLLELDEISYVTLSGQEDLEIAIEIPQHVLRRYGLTIEQVADTIRQTSLDLPAGGVKTEGGEILLRTAERRNDGTEFADIPIVTSQDGSVIRLGEIAEIKDGFRESDLSCAFEGKNVVWLRVYSAGDQSPPDVAAATKAYAAELEDQMPPGVQVTTWLDLAQMYAERLDLLRRNAMIGLALVLVVLGLFLDPRVSFWVTMGIPVAFLGSFVLLPALGVSLNMLSMFAFIVTLGMVVDDAIVVGENIYRLRRQGLPPLEAAIQGAREVAMPVFFSIATTVAAFSPLLFVPGAAGRVVFAIPVIVVLVLILSLVESFFILPAHLAHTDLDRQRGIIGLIRRGQRRVSAGLERFIAGIYGPFVRAGIRQRWITLAIWIALLIGSLGLQAGGRLKTVFMPEEESDWVHVEAKLPFGVPVEESTRLKDRLVAAAHRVIERNGGPEINKGILSLVAGDGSHTVEIWSVLAPADERPISSKAFVDQWRTELGDVAGLQMLKFDSSTGNDAKPIDIRLSHQDPAVLETAARELAAYLRGYKGVKDVEDGIELGKTQLDFTLSREGISTGFTAAQVATQVRSAFYGREALRQQRGKDEVRVIVRLPRSERESLGNVEDLILRTPSGSEMPLSRVAQVHEGQAYTALKRYNGKRNIRVKADVVEGEANSNEVIAAAQSEFMPGLLAKYPGLSESRAGSQKEQEEFMRFLIFGFLMALLGIYGLIAIPLRSYWQPLFVVMIAIPFGFVGAFLGHVLLDLDLCIYSWLGVVALSGVVVNDSIVFVHAANRFRQNGMSAMEAAAAAAEQRFRPILLTSLTTFGGLSPMIFESSVQARVLVPMAVSLGFGVLMSTAVILTLVPSMFVIIENLRSWWTRRKEVQRARESVTVTPAKGLVGGTVGLIVALCLSTAGATEEPTVAPPAPAAHDLPELTPGASLSIGEALRLADQRNLSLEAARAEILAADADLYRSWGALFPVVSGSLTLTHLDYEDTADINGIEIVTRPRDSLQGGLNVDLPLVSPRGWQAIHLQKKRLQVSKLTLAEFHQRLLLTVARAFYQALTAQTLVKVIEGQIRSNERHLEVAKSRLTSGIGRRVDVIRAQSDLARFREQLLSAHAAFNNARDTLGTLTGMGGLPLPTEEKELRFSERDERLLVAEGNQSREDLQLKRGLVTLYESQRFGAWMQFLPSLNLSWQLSHQFTGQDQLGLDDRTRWTAFLSLSVPIYGQTRYADLDKGRALVKKAQLELSDAEQQAALQIRTALRNYSSAVEKVKTAITQAELAHETLVLTESEYIMGTGTSLAVTDARRSSNEAEINRATRSFEAQITLLELYRAAGQDLRHIVKD